MEWKVSFDRAVCALLHAAVAIRCVVFELKAVAIVIATTLWILKTEVTCDRAIGMDYLPHGPFLILMS